MKYKSLISAHITKDESGNKDIEIFNEFNNNSARCDIFDNMPKALIEYADMEDKSDYFILALVVAERVEIEDRGMKGYDIEVEITEIDSFKTLQAVAAKLI